MQTMTFTAAIMAYFGKKPGQTTQEFMQELKALDEKDRAYFKQEFLTVGIQVI